MTAEELLTRAETEQDIELKVALLYAWSRLPRNERKHTYSRLSAMTLSEYNNQNFGLWILQRPKGWLDKIRARAQAEGLLS